MSGLEQRRAPVLKANDKIRLTTLSSRHLHFPMAVPFDHSQFRRACARFATGITITTVTAPDGTPHGLTANSFTSVSAEPPLVLICVDHRANVLPHFETAEYYGVNVLSQSQEALSVRFSERGLDRFDGVEWSRGEHGVPLLCGTLARFECRICNRIVAGDHTILIGEVLYVEYEDGSPLVYYSSAYRTIPPPSGAG